MKENDTWYRCTICGREGLVGRCCGDETREPLNELAIKEQAKIKKSQKTTLQQLKAEIRSVAIRIETCHDDDWPYECDKIITKLRELSNI